MAKPVVLMDLDSVVVDLTDAWFYAYYAGTGEIIPLDYDTWDLRKLVKDGDYLYGILDQPGFFLDLPALPGAIDGLREIAAVTDVIISTSALDNPNAAKDKMLWVRKYLPFIKKGNIMIGTRKDLLMADIMVDDSPGNLKKTLAKHKIVMDYPYNRKVRDAERVHDWKELVEAVKRYVEAS